MIEIASTAKVSPLSDIEDSVRGTRIIVGPGVTIDSFVKIKPAGGAGDVVIGEGLCSIRAAYFIQEMESALEKHVAVAANCTFAPTNHEYADRNVLIARQGFRPSKGGITVGDDVWFGANCVILDGSDIGQGCVIGAGSIVRGKLEPYGVYAGSPLRKIGERR